MPSTEGQTRVVYTFNPSGHPGVQGMKERCAALIDEIQAIGDGPDADHHTRRWAALAASDFETACMYAVKAVTHEPCPEDRKETASDPPYMESRVVQSWEYNDAGDEVILTLDNGNTVRVDRKALSMDSLRMGVVMIRPRPPNPSGT